MGDVVDQNVVNSVIIGGILGFTSQNDANLQLKARVSELESDLKTGKLRIDSLENWMTRNEEDKKIIEKDKKSVIILLLCLASRKKLQSFSMRLLQSLSSKHVVNVVKFSARIPTLKFTWKKTTMLTRILSVTYVANYLFSSGD